MLHNQRSFKTIYQLTATLTHKDTNNESEMAFVIIQSECCTLPN